MQEKEKNKTRNLVTVWQVDRTARGAAEVPTTDDGRRDRHERLA